MEEVRGGLEVRALVGGEVLAFGLDRGGEMEGGRKDTFASRRKEGRSANRCTNLISLLDFLRVRCCSRREQRKYRKKKIFLSSLCLNPTLFPFAR